MIIAKDLATGYNGIPVVNNMNFTIEDGSYVCITGENGAGKSTLMKTILGIIPPVSGEIANDEKNGIGYLPQQTQLQKDFPASVSEVILSGFVASHKWNIPFYSKEEKQTAKEMAVRVGMAKHLTRSYRELSGGQQQRVLLARALCASRGMIFLDEPVAGLDPEAQEEMYDIIGELNHEGTTIIMITHDMDAPKKYATHELRISRDNGRCGKAVFV